MNEKLKETKNMLKKLFMYAVSDEKIKKVRKKNLLVGYNENYKQGFFSKYFLSMLDLTTYFHVENKKEVKFEILNILNISFFLSFFVGYFINFKTTDLIIALISMFTTLSTMYGFKMMLENQNKIAEEVLDYDKEELLDLFSRNKLEFSSYYVENEKLNKEQLEEVLRFIKSNMTEKEIVKTLFERNEKNITDVSALYVLLLKIKYELELKDRLRCANLKKAEMEENIIEILHSVSKKEEVKDRVLIKV